MPPPRPPRPLLYALLSCGIVGLHLSANLAENGLPGGHLMPSLDDAWIHARYADALWRGEPFVYSPGEGFSSGATSLLWPLLLLPGLALGLQPSDLHLLALLWAVPLLALSALAADRWIASFDKEDGGDGSLGLWAGLSVVLCGPYAWGAASGMEVGLVGAALVWTVERHRRGEVPDAGMALCLGALSLSRPEGMLVALVAAADLGWRHRGHPARLRALAALAPALLGALQPALNLLYTGQITGTSVLAKHNPRMILPGDVSPLDWLIDNALVAGYGQHFSGAAGLLILPIAGIGLCLISQRQRWIPAVAFLIAPVTLALVMPMLLNQARHLMPGLVIYVPAAVYGAARIGRVAGEERPWLRAILLLHLAAGGLQWAQTTARSAADLRQQHAAAAAWLSRHAALGEVIAVNDAGFVPVLADRPILDLEGVTSSSTLPWALAGEGSVLALLDRARPAWIVTFPAWFPALAPALSPQWSSKIAKRTVSGGDTMQIARLDTALLENAHRPPALVEGEAVLDALDLSDLDSEAAHRHTQDEDPVAAARANTAVLAAAEDGVMSLEGARRYMGCTGFVIGTSEARPIRRLVARLGPSSGEALIAVALGEGEGAEIRRLAVPAIPDGRWRDLSLELSRPTADVAVRLCVESAPGGVRGGVQIARWWGIGG